MRYVIFLGYGPKAMFQVKAELATLGHADTLDQAMLFDSMADAFKWYVDTIDGVLLDLPVIDWIITTDKANELVGTTYSPK